MMTRLMKLAITDTFYAVYVVGKIGRGSFSDYPLQVLKL